MATMPLEGSHAARNGFILAGVVVVVFVVSVFLVQLMQNNDTMQRCFVLKEGTVSTYLVIEDGTPNASMTVIERENGKDVVPQSTGPGTLEENAITLVDGTRLEFNDTQLVWPEGSLLAGSVFTASDCPAY